MSPCRGSKCSLPVCDTDFRTGCRGVSLHTPVCSPPPPPHFSITVHSKFSFTECPEANTAFWCCTHSPTLGMWIRRVLGCLIVLWHKTWIWANEEEEEEEVHDLTFQVWGGPDQGGRGGWWRRWWTRHVTCAGRPTPPAAVTPLCTSTSVKRLLINWLL